MFGPTLKRLSASPLSVLLSVTLLLQVTVTVVSSQKNIMKQDDCSCVPYYFCKNNTFLKSGKGLIDIKIVEGHNCHDILDVCCNKKMIIREPTEKDMIMDKMIWELYPKPQHPTQPLDKCKCLPYYLCNNGTIVTNGRGLIDIKFGEDKPICPDILDVCCNQPKKTVQKPDNNIDKYIWAVFPKPPHPSPPTDECRCVPLHLCRDENIMKTTLQKSINIDIYKKWCTNSVDVCCYNIIRSSVPNEPLLEHRTICGQWNPEGISNSITRDSNNKAQFGEFPWMMAILKLESNQSKTYLCGGSLIHPKVVLTAVHCVKKVQNANDLVIRAGEWDTQTDNELLPSQDHQVLKIINHADFEPLEVLNDVSLIIVTKPFLLRQNVGTICLPSPNFVFENQRCHASGWGKDKFGKLGVNQVILKKIELPIVPYDPCLALLRKTRLGPEYILPEGFICAGGEIGKDTCDGDGGSPLMCPIENRPNQFHQAGITAWGIGCGGETPGAYVDVAYFRNWIDEKMDQENLDKSYYDPDYVPAN